MYESYFAFKRAPFSIAPDPSFLYPSPQHRKGLEQLNHGLNKEGGFIVLTGEVGTGKTTLSRLFLSQIPNTVQIATVFNAKLSSSDLLSNIVDELKLESSSDASDFEKTQAISRQLEQNHNDQRKTLLVIEEAQNLSADALETLRLLTNIETNTEKLIHILLIGQPELVTTLNRLDLRQLNQRVIARFHLRPLNQEETENYLIHRLSVAGGQQAVFGKSAITALFKHSNGIPRLINLIADRALQIAFEANQKQAKPKDIESATALINGHLPEAPKNNKDDKILWLVIAGLIIFVLSMVLVFFWTKPSGSSTETESKNSNANEAVTSLSEAPSSEPQVEQPTVEEPKAVEPVKPAPVLTPSEKLLSLWQIDYAASTDLCAEALANELLCYESNRLSLNDVLALNRPALITIFDQQGLAQTAVITRYSRPSVYVYSQGVEQVYTRASLQQRWRGDVSLLWRPPAGWLDSVRVNDSAPTVIEWLTESLTQLDLIEGKVISGGVYNNYFSEHVKRLQAEAGLEADGILGRKTVMAINTRLNAAPPLQ